MPVSQTPPNRTGDGVLKVMKIIISKFERQTNDYVFYSEVVGEARMSRIMLDVYLEEAKSLKLITQDNERDIWLTNIGKHYAIQHKIIKP